MLMTSATSPSKCAEKYCDGDAWCSEKHVQQWLNNIHENESSQDESSSKSSCLSSLPTSDDEMEVGADAHLYNQQKIMHSPRLSPLLPDADNLLNADNFSDAGSSSCDSSNINILEVCKPPPPNTDNEHYQINQDQHNRVIGFDTPSALAALLQPDPEDILLNLGFRNTSEGYLLQNIPSRFLQHGSTLSGIDVDAFQNSTITEVNAPDTSSVPRRFRFNSVSGDSLSSQNTEECLLILFESCHSALPSIHLSYDGDSSLSPSNSVSMESTQRGSSRSCDSFSSQNASECHRVLFKSPHSDLPSILLSYAEDGPPLPSNSASMEREQEGRALSFSSFSSQNIEECNGVLFKSSHSDLPSIHLSYDGDSSLSPSNSASVESAQTRGSLSSLAGNLMPSSRRGSFEYGLSNEVNGEFRITHDVSTSLNDKERQMEGNGARNTCGMYTNLVVPFIKRSGRDKGGRRNITVVAKEEFSVEDSMPINAPLFQTVIDGIREDSSIQDFHGGFPEISGKADNRSASIKRLFFKSNSSSSNILVEKSDEARLIVEAGINMKHVDEELGVDKQE